MSSAPPSPNPDFGIGSPFTRPPLPLPSPPSLSSSQNGASYSALPKSWPRSKPASSSIPNHEDVDHHQGAINATTGTTASQPSLPDRIAATALTGTLELLRHVGEATLHTTGALVAPPLHLTRTVVLPNLWAALVDYLASSSPVRLQDWFRIVQSSAYHIYHALQNTEAGHALSQRVWIVAADLVSCLCADSTRQVLVDAMATMVKLADLSLQATLTACRAIDALSSGRCKLLAYDVRAAWAAAVALAADPVTITALAEVTAYLCYALEMEESALAAAAAAASHHGSNRDGTETTATATARTGGMATRSGPQRRRERNIYQNITTTQADTLQGGRSVEDVILGSLGTTGITNNTSNDAAFSDSDDPSTATTPIILNSNILGKSNPKHAGRNSAHEDAATSSLSSAPPRSATAASSNYHEWHHERARRDVNVQALRQGIEERAVRLKAEKHYQSVHLAAAGASAAAVPLVPESTANESMPRIQPNGTAVAPQSNDDTGENLDLEELGVVYTVEEKDPNGTQHNDQAEREQSTNTTQRRRVALTESQSFPADSHTMTDSNDVAQALRDDDPLKESIQDGTSVQQFHRILAEILTAQRDEAIRQTLAGGKDKRTRLPTIGTLRRRPTTTTNASGTTTSMAGRQTTVRDRLAALRAELVTGPSATEMERLNRIKRVLGKEGKMVLVIGAMVVAAIALFWIAFGCYGLYMFFRSTPLPLPHAHVVPSATQEIVVRIIREGATTLGNEDNELKASQADLENVAQCVASVFK
jgi:hypothetical protein